MHHMHHTWMDMDLHCVFMLADYSFGCQCTCCLNKALATSVLCSGVLGGLDWKIYSVLTTVVQI